MAAYQTLSIHKDDAVDWVTFNRPDNLNALNRRMVDELLDYYGALYWDKSVRVVVMRGAGRGYCAGLDLKERDNSSGPNTPANGMTMLLFLPSSVSKNLEHSHSQVCTMGILM